jgi:predicted dehydrogenase
MIHCRMRRRTFLMFGAGGLAAQVPPSSQIVVGLIGAGRRGMQLLQVLLAEPSVRIGAICETYEPRMFEAVALARSAGHRTRYYRLYGDLLADASLDAAVIATPDFWHCRMMLEALDRGKDVYLERPLSRTWEEGVRMIAVHRASKQVVQVGLQWRSSPNLAPLAAGRVRRIEGRATASQLRNGVLQRGPTKLPEPLNFEDWQAAAENRVPYSPDRFLNWRFYSAYGGGCLADLGVPWFDAVHVVTGMNYPVSVLARGKRSTEAGFDTAARATVEVEYGGGVRAFLSIDGTSTRTEALASFRREHGYVKTRLLTTSDSTRVHVRDFLTSVKSRTPPHAPPAVVFPASLICQMADISMRSGVKVYWDAQSAAPARR